MEFRKLSNNEDLSFYEALNASAFGEAEGFPITTFLKAQDDGIVEIFSIEEEGPVGFMVTASNENVCYLGYFAISEDKRGQGLGTKAISLLKETIGDKQLVLETEKVTKKTPYESIAMKRRRFYLAQHIHLSHYEDIFRNHPYQIMCTGQDLRVKDFTKILESLKTMGYDPEVFKEDSKK